MDHNQDSSLGQGFAALSMILFMLGKIIVHLEDVASFFVIISGACSLIINWAKIKKRIMEISEKIKNFLS